MCRVSIHNTTSNAYTIYKNMNRKKPKQRKENIIKMSLLEMGCDGVDWIKLAVDMDDWRGHKQIGTDNLCVPFNLRFS
jgi:hypothetical protein